MTPSRRAPRWTLSAAAGIASAILGIGAAELTAALVNPAASPVLVVGSAAIDLAPGWAKTLAILLFGTGDKAALITGIVAVLLLLSAAAGVLERLRTGVGRILFGILAIVAVAAALTRSGAGTLDAVPAFVAGVGGVVGLAVLIPRLGVDEPAAGEPDPGRRAFLGWTAGGAGAGVLAYALGTALSAGSRAAAAARAAITLPAPATTAAPVPPGAELGIPGLSPVVTPNADFYRIDTALQVPSIDPANWSLKITGMVEQEVTLTWAQLLALPLEESVTTLMCVSNEVGGNLIGTARWLGYPIRDLLAQAKPLAGADMVLSTSSDGFTASTPLPVLQDTRNAILAVGMNGAPLPAEHGFPVRMVVPGLYGYVSATKWVTTLEVTTFASRTAYWTARGWSDHGPVKLESRIDVPRGNAAVSAGRVAVAGVAWHQHVGVSAVEVSVDGGAWMPAQLAEAISIDTWRQWHYAWDATPGRHDLAVRATGADGEVQTAAVQGTVPDGATGHHTITVQVN